MRSVLMFVIIIFSLSAEAQTILPLSYSDYSQQRAFANSLRTNDSSRQNKWFLSTYSSISTSFSFYKGANATMVAAPLGLQLNRRLNDNLYAFAGIAVAPAFMHFNQNMPVPNGFKTWQNNGRYQQNGFGMYSRAEMGLMYINDSKTFSISGSIGVERNSYPVMPYYPNAARPEPARLPN